jgi:hypothetical protein
MVTVVVRCPQQPHLVKTMHALSVRIDTSFVPLYTRGREVREDTRAETTPSPSGRPAGRTQTRQVQDPGWDPVMGGAQMTGRPIALALTHH